MKQRTQRTKDVLSNSCFPNALQVNGRTELAQCRHWKFQVPATDDEGGSDLWPLRLRYHNYRLYECRTTDSRGRMICRMIYQMICEAVSEAKLNHIFHHIRHQKGSDCFFSSTRQILWQIRNYHVEFTWRNPNVTQTGGSDSLYDPFRDVPCHLPPGLRDSRETRLLLLRDRLTECQSRLIQQKSSVTRLNLEKYSSSATKTIQVEISKFLHVFAG